MEWIQRNPRKTAGLAALGLLFVLVVLRGVLSGPGHASTDPTLGPSLAVPTTTPTGIPNALSSPSAVPTSTSDVMQALAAAGSAEAKGELFGAGGSAKGLTPHHVVIAAQSDGPLMAVGWWIPLADGVREGSDTSGSRSFSHGDRTYGDSDLARILAYGGPYSKTTTCTVTVDGKVTDRQSAKGPYAKVFCQG